MLKTIICIYFTFFIFSAQAISLSTEEKKDCQLLLQIAEKKDADWIYDACYFDDPAVVWYDWAPYLSLNNYAKGLYQICKRFPNEEYTPLYCQKSAEAGSIPALYKLAKQAQEQKNIIDYEKYLQQIVAKDTLSSVRNFSRVDKITLRQAYLELAQLFHEGNDITKKQNIIPFLQKSADSGSPIASSTLAVFLYLIHQDKDMAMVDKYIWQAVMAGCPYAEANLGLIYAQKNKKISFSDFEKLTQNKLFVCDKPRKKAPQIPALSSKKAEDCPCAEVLSWYETQKDKPYLVLSIQDGEALLQDPENNQYIASVGEKISNGYVVGEIRSTAIILTRQTERVILRYQPQIECLEVCQRQKSAKQPQKRKTNTDFEITFTDSECKMIAQNIEGLDNPLNPFLGVYQCQLQDWVRWGEDAILNNRNKHLFLLANYEKSNYIPSYVARAKLLFASAGEKAYHQIIEILKPTLTEKTTDSLDKTYQEYAFCLTTSLYLTEGNEKEAFSVASLGYEKNFPYSANQLGVFYANGTGTQKDLTKALEVLKKAEEFSPIPFVEAKQNEKNLFQKQQKEFLYGDCEHILTPVQPEKSAIIQAYRLEN